MHLAEEELSSEKRAEKWKLKEKKREDEEKEVYYSLLNSPCTAFHKTIQAILKCLGLETSSISPSSSSSSSKEDHGTEIVQETGFMAMVTRLVRRRPRPAYSSGRPGQID
ncbi:hypothetical protein Bca4012_032875 [Brassica carinata]|uniref:Elicitor peptide 6 n=1 Tax=Brassica carinata TaxID=52824 RepID=A0A8X7REM9_BRACI|nr:PREDICTED: elicitor peptide 6-like [Brassica oleracea var. oleracea]KAG2286612.1 hypothetical protein Bca52824_046216 [Brassica carinata]